MSGTKISKKKLNFSGMVFAIFFLLTLFKLYIVSGEEILARFAPHDELWYILAARHWFWFSPNYDLMTIIHLPVYPIFIALVHSTGIPLRIGIEVAFLSSGFYFVYALRRIGINQIICLLAYILIILHPLSFDLFNRTLAETFYAPLLMASLASIILMLINAKKKKLFFSIMTGFFLALLWFTREESILILGVLFMVSILAVFITLRETRDWKKAFNKLKTALFIPAIIIISFSVLIQTANYFKYGLFAASEMNGFGYKAAYTALLRIKPEKPVRFVPITSETRKVAYSISPSFKELEPYLEDHSNFAYSWTKKEMGIENEMAAGWFYWMLREAVNSAGYKTAPEENAFYERVADEINKGIAEKKIPKRFVLFSFLDPGTFSYLSHLPDSLKKIIMLFTETRKPAEAGLTDNIFSGQNKIIIDSMTNRRTHNTTFGSITLNGWVFLKGGNIIKVSLESENGEKIASTESFISRPDVQVGYKNDANNIPIDSGFILEINQPEESLTSTSLVFYSEDNKRFQVPYSKLDLLESIRLEPNNANQSLYFAIDQKVAPGIPMSLSFKNYIQDIVWLVYGNVILFLSYLGILSFLVMICLWKLLDYKKPIYTMLLILFFVVATRTLLFTVLDVDSWNAAQQPRYLFPVMPVYSTFLLVLIYQASVLIREKIFCVK